MLRAKQRLMLVVPLTLLIIILIIYLNTRSAIKTAIVLLAVPFSLVGAFWILYLLNYNLSVAVWVGLIALAGLDAETGVVMLLYLDLAYEEWIKKGQMRNVTDLRDAIYHGAVKRVRPKAMTACVIIAGLMPILWSHGAGADVMKRIATPMIGGVVTSTVMELVVYPAIFYLWRSRRLMQVKGHAAPRVKGSQLAVSPLTFRPRSRAARNPLAARPDRGCVLAGMLAYHSIANVFYFQTLSRASPHTERLPGQVSPRLSLKSAVPPHRMRLGRRSFARAGLGARSHRPPQLTVAAAIKDQRLVAAAKTCRNER